VDAKTNASTRTEHKPKPDPSPGPNAHPSPNANPNQNQSPRRTLPGLDIAALQEWLLAHQPELLGAVPLGANLIAGGRSNLTYAIRGAAEPLVLRRPPLGHVQSTAHDMAREFRIIAAAAFSFHARSGTLTTRRRASMHPST
jgi:hypothetical protein